MRTLVIGFFILFTILNIFTSKAQLPNDRGLQPGTPPIEMYSIPPNPPINNPDFYSRWFHRLGFSWNLFVIQCPMAWEISKGKNSTVIVAAEAALGKPGEKIQNHPDVSAKMSMNTTDNVRILTDQHTNISKNNDGSTFSPQTAIEPAIDGNKNYDFLGGLLHDVDQLNNPQAYGHPLAVLSCAISKGNNGSDNGGNMIGSCFNCEGVHTGLLGGYYGPARMDVDMLVNGVITPPDIVNMSYDNGGPGDDYLRLKNAILKGVVCIAAAGNARDGAFPNIRPMFDTTNVSISPNPIKIKEYLPAVTFNASSTYEDTDYIISSYNNNGLIVTKSNPRYDYKVIGVGSTSDGGRFFNGNCDLYSGQELPPQKYSRQNTGELSEQFSGQQVTGIRGSWNFSPGTNKFSMVEEDSYRMRDKEEAFVDIVCPGDEVMVATYTTGDNETKYRLQASGTSLSAPIVSGVVGLMLSTNKLIGVVIGTMGTNGHLLTGRDVQRKVYDILTFTADKIPDSNNISRDLHHTGTAPNDYYWRYSYFNGVTDANNHNVFQSDYQFNYVVQQNDHMKRSWAQRMGFGRVNAFRAVAHAIGKKGAYKYQASETLQFENTGNGNVNEDDKALMHFGHWANATQSVYETAGNVFSGESSAWKNNNGMTIINGTGTTLTVPTNSILAIDGIVTTEDVVFTNKKIIKSQGSSTTDPGKILITGYLENVNVEGRIKASDLLITAGTTNPAGSGLSFQTNSSIPFAANQVSEIYGVVTMKSNGTLEVYNNSGCIMQPGSKIDMQGNKNIYVRSGATLTMKSASTITGTSGRKIIVENGGKLIIGDENIHTEANYNYEGQNVDIFAEVEVLDGGQFILGQGCSLRLNRFTIQSGGTMQCMQKSSLFLNKASTWGQTEDNYCYGKLLVEGNAAERVTIDGKRLNICNEIGQGATINIRGDYAQTAKNRFKLQFADINNVKIQGLDVYSPEAIDNVVFKLSRNVTQSNHYDAITGRINSEFRLSLISQFSTRANTPNFTRSVQVKNCQFMDQLSEIEFGSITANNWNAAAYFSGLEIRGYDFAAVENSTFNHLNICLSTFSNNNLSILGNEFKKSNHGITDASSLVFACSNTLSTLPIGALFTSSPTVQLNNNSFTISESATIGVSSPRVLYRSNTFTEFLNAVRVEGGLANLSYRISPQGVYEKFGRNLFSVTNPALGNPNRFAQYPYDLPFLSDVWFGNANSLLWASCGFNKFAEFTTYHVSGGAARTLLDGSVNFWQDPNNATGLIRVPATWPTPQPGTDLNQSQVPVASCNGVSENTLCLQCQGKGIPPAYAAAGNGQQNNYRPKKGGEQLLTNTLPDVMQERTRLSDELAALRNTDSLHAFITRISPTTNDDEFLLTGKYLYKGLAYERLSEFDSARSAYHSITALQHSSSDSLVAAWHLQWIDVETGNFDSLTPGEAQAAYYQRVAYDLLRKRPDSSLPLQAVPYSNNTSNAAVAGVTGLGEYSQTKDNTVKENSPSQTSTSGTEEDEEFNNANIICEQTVCKIKTFRIGRLYPQPVTNSTFTIEAESYENATNVTAEIFSIIGQKLATLWEGNLKKGASTISMTLNDIPAGSYIFYLKNNKGEVVDYNRLVVADGQK